MAFALAGPFDVAIFFNSTNGILSTPSSLWPCSITETASGRTYDKIYWTRYISLNKYIIKSVRTTKPRENYGVSSRRSRLDFEFDFYIFLFRDETRKRSVELSIAFFIRCDKFGYYSLMRVSGAIKQISDRQRL